MRAWLTVVVCCAAIAALPLPGAEQPRNWQELLREARVVAQTNPAAASALTDRAVALSGSNVTALMMRAKGYEARGEYAKAAADLTRVVEQSPEAAGAWQLRGTLHFRMSKFRESVEDFDRALKLMPEKRPDHWQRGISLYYAGDFEEGRKQFELHESVNPNDVENAAWHYLCVARSKGVEKAREQLLKPGHDARRPMMAVYELYAGRGTEEKVLADAGEDREGRFYAHLYLGLFHEAQGNRAKAREQIGKAVAIGPRHYMGDVARVHQKVLEGTKQ